jgi:hypothetical protein
LGIAMGFLPDGVESSGSATRKLIMKKYLREIGYEVGRWWNWLSILSSDRLWY